MSYGLVILLVSLAFLIGYLIGRRNHSSQKSSKSTIPTGKVNKHWSLSMVERDEIKQMLQANRKIEAIKRYREITGSSLKQAKEAVEQIEKDHD